MPIIASQTFNINIKKDKSIKIKFLEDLKSKKCVKISSYASKGNEKDQLRDIVLQLVGEKAIECDNDTCCITENYHNFVDKLNGLNK